MLEYQDDTKMRNLTDAVTKMREKYGMDIVRGGGEMQEMLFITLVCFIVLILQIFHIKHQSGVNLTRHLLSSSF